MQYNQMQTLRAMARKLYEEHLKVNPGETIVVVTDGSHNRRIAEAAFAEALNLYGERYVHLVRIWENRPANIFSPPLPEVPEVYKRANVIVAPVWGSITHSPETKEARENGARVVSMPGTSEYAFIQALSADAGTIQQLGRLSKRELTELDEITIKSPKGTDLTLYFDRDRQFAIDGGDFSQQGCVGNIPFGEVAVAPIETRGEGKAVFSLSSFVAGDFTLYLKDGKIVEWDERGKSLMEFLKRYTNGDIIAEFAIGINPSIRYEPHNPNFNPYDTVANEKIYRTCHVAFGNSTVFGGKNYSEVHDDVIILEPSLVSKGRRLDLWEQLDRIKPL